MTGYTYVGTELELFAAAPRWKQYLRRQIARYLGADVLEVGAGIGSTTKALCQAQHRRWTCLEPDRSLLGQLSQAIEAGELPGFCHAVAGTLDDVADLAPFDTLLYIDVIEHIEDDRGQLARASGLIKPGGHLVVLSPAHQFLYTPFDRAIGHYRRYTRNSLLVLEPPAMKVACTAISTRSACSPRWETACS